MLLVYPKQIRKSQTSIGKIYFFAATIHNWYPLLLSERHKDVIINYLKKSSDQKLITVYAFRIMPNRVHLIWQQNKLNGKETPFGSFLKHTAHVLLRELKLDGSETKYKVIASNKAYEIWMPDSLAIEINSREVARQKIDYIHAIPVSGKLGLAMDDISYHYSSAGFYHNQIDNFGFLNDLFLYFGGI